MDKITSDILKKVKNFIKNESEFSIDDKELFQTVCSYYPEIDSSIILDIIYS